MPIDVLVVGQGLAGSLLAWQLLREGFSVLVIDDGQQNASQVAAGLINPVTGQRLVKTACVDTLLPVAMKCYQELTDFFQETFFVSLPMFRVLSSIKMRQVAEQRLADTAYQVYLDGLFEQMGDIAAEHGVLQQQHTGYLRTEALLECLRQYFCERQAYRCVSLDYAEVKLEGALAWQDVRPKHVVFCEGHHGRSNPWFGCLPFQVAKGEILDCQSTMINANRIINFGDWYLPLGLGRFKLGATFEKNFSNLEASHEAKHSLLARLAHTLPALTEVDVIDQRAGIRPTTQDKHPFIGTHPRYPGLHIFNGFGAKGSLMIPGYAQYFVAWLKQRMPLPTHCDIQRFHEICFPA
jgi:glycine/D-amino acid oxidase-like deaminating enzyme